MSFLCRECSRLEEAFFLEQDQHLLAELRKEAKVKQTRQALKEVSGIDNELVLDKLIELDVRPEVVASLSLVPLIEVAWADGHADAKEKQAILEASQKVGLVKGEIDYELLSRWLDRQPGPELMTAWILFVKALCEKLSDDERAALKQEILADARAVAAASGGFLGIGKSSRSEKLMLQQLEQAFEGDLPGCSSTEP
ncbi:MAG: hypothetical protein JW797_07910 [Bradymonadales bacterium]|nr:hypothetical protein [Bradymonadales bacterium]